MTLGCEMDDAVHVLILNELEHVLEVADVHADKLVVRLVFNVLQVGKVASVGEFVEVDDLILGIFIDEQTDYVRADEAGAAGDDDAMHVSKLKVES
jgi:hypothetical protein